MASTTDNFNLPAFAPSPEPPEGFERVWRGGLHGWINVPAQPAREPARVVTIDMGVGLDEPEVLDDEAAEEEAGWGLYGDRWPSVARHLNCLRGEG